MVRFEESRNILLSEDEVNRLQRYKVVIKDIDIIDTTYHLKLYKEKE